MIEKIIQSDKAHPINLYKELLYPYLDDEQDVFSPLLVGITNSNPKYKITRPPIHRDFSIEYVYEGKGVIKHGDDVFEAKAHDAFILHPNTTHNYYSDPEQPWKKYGLWQQDL